MKYDIVIVGGGIVGATLALALAQKTSLTIALLEARKEKESWNPTQKNLRVSAISLASQHIFAALGVWQDMKNKRVSPFSRIEVWNANAANTFHFDSREISESVLGYIIENNVIQSALDEKMQEYSQITRISPIKLHSFCGNEIKTTDDRLFSGQLTIGADGAHSWVREQAQLGVDKVDYKQHALVATVISSLSHQACARQVFHKDSILAFLPLTDAQSCSIVWTLPDERAKHLMNVDVHQFKTELEKEFDSCLGKIEEVDERRIFPLFKQQTKKYVQSGLALVGDAAHTVHPLAGQGVNMGLLDAAALYDVIQSACEKNRDFASLSYLRRYERGRKADHFALLYGLDVIKNLYMSEKKSVNFLRECGLNVTARLQWLKNMFVHHAVGKRLNLPTLALPPSVRSLHKKVSPSS